MQYLVGAEAHTTPIKSTQPKQNRPTAVSKKMATSVLRFSLRLSTRKTGILSRNPGLKTSAIPRTTQSRTAVSTPSGAILPKPDKTPFGLIRMTAVVVPFLYVGTLISKNFAALLEEHDIFVPEDDDDDD
ncbi:single-pass membrane protein with aspartate-rich tail 1b [Menidia menidia]